MATGSWADAIDLSTPAGVALKKLAAVLPKDRPLRITLFGSAPIQITVANGLCLRYESEP
ncbi:MAG: hypothetical protein HYY24_08370 [Verrucomicrobia bacterium]|nr:hypothetical protein [Verrucomicrobiota bacterium]